MKKGIKDIKNVKAAREVLKNISEYILGAYHGTPEEAHEILHFMDEVCSFKFNGLDVTKAILEDKHKKGLKGLFDDF